MVKGQVDVHPVELPTAWGEIEKVEASMTTGDHHGDGEELLGLVMDAHSDYRRGKAAVIEAAIRGGQHLLTAKESLPHRDFLPFLERAGLEPRTAQRWMSLARTGWKCDTVSYLGGVVKALKMHKAITDEGSLQATDEVGHGAARYTANPQAHHRSRVRGPAQRGHRGTE